MGNILKETMGKVAANVTQSVVSAIIVFLITTYLLVDAGKKEQAKEQAEKTADSLKHQMPVFPLQEVRPGVKSGQSAAPLEGIAVKSLKSQESPVREPKVQKVNETGGQQPASKLPVTATPEKKGGPFREQPERAVVGQSETVGQEVQTEPPKNPVVKKQERSTADTLEQKKPKNEIQKVKKRADDVFDELDQEAQKKAPE